MRAESSGPWYRHRWPWILLALLGTSISLTLGMVAISMRQPDTLVSDHYYEAGKGINRALDRERLARSLGVRASLRLDTLTGEVDLRLHGASQPAALELNLISPTRAGQDRRVVLQRSTAEPDRYVGHLVEPLEGWRFVELLGEEPGGPWRLFEEETLGGEQPLHLGDEPLQGAQTP
jgi:hypothetical protein